ncbi:MAG: SRPBCC family protein [Aurantimicrobium sp.]|nr:SRPBCC family protein [Aurantimicrobium sp.]
MARNSRRAYASKKAKQSSKKKILRLEITHSAVVPRDPVVTFRALTDGRGELTSLDLVGAPTKAAHIDKVADRAETFTENAARVTLTNGISFDYRETSRTPGKFFSSQMSNFTGRGTLFLNRVVSEWTLTPLVVPGNAIGYTTVTWTIKFYPRSPLARWIMRMWLSLHWRHVSARGMSANLKRVVEIDEPSVSVAARPAVSAIAGRAV